MHIYNLFQKECSFLRQISFFILSIVFSLIFSIKGHAEITPVQQNIYHVHVGDNSRNAGCYTVPKPTTITYEEKCPGKMVYFPDYDKSQCSYCGAAANGDQSYRECYTKTYYDVTTYTYELGCGKTTKTVMGTFSAVKSTDEWTKEVDIAMELSLKGAVKKNAAPFIINGTACNEYTYKATSCGSYSISLNTATGYKASPIVLDVKNIDTIGPTIVSYSLSTSEWTNSPVILSLDSVADLQPDNTPGCGLDEKPISYDNGATWTSDTTHTFKSSSSINIMLKDMLGNISTTNLEISNIDNEAPRINTIDYDTTPNVKSVNVAVYADDVMSNGKNGCGLHDKPYSFDKGQTWQSDNVIQIDKCCTLPVWVRDRLDNTQKTSIEINNIDCYGPSISYKLSPAGKTTGPVTVTITATDRGPKGSNGIGLPEDYLSFDNGQTWTSQNTYKTSTNTKLNILAKDINDNTSSAEIKVSNIGSPKKEDESIPVKDETPPESDPDPEPNLPKPTQAPEQVVPPAVIPKTPPKVTPKPTEPVISQKVKPIIKPPKDAKPKITQTIISEPVLKSDNSTLIDTLPKDDSSHIFRDFIVTFIGICAVFFLLLLLFLIIYRMVSVYNLESKDKFIFKGFCLIRRKETFELTITQKMLDKCPTGQFRFKFNRLFITFHEGENIVVYLPDKQSYIIQPETNVELTIKI